MGRSSPFENYINKTTILCLWLVCDVGEGLWEESSALAKSYSEYREQELNYDRKRISTRTVTLNLKQKGFIGGYDHAQIGEERKISQHHKRI